MCHAKSALQRGYRPQINCPTSARLVTKVCSRRCIFCDIWKLATLVSTHVPLSSRYNIRPQTQSSIILRERQIESALSTQRAQLASVMSICIVEGAEQSEGLRIAYERCFDTIKKLLLLEAEYEDELIYSYAEAKRRNSGDSYYSSSQQACAAAENYYSESYYTSERRPSYAGLAM